MEITLRLTLILAVIASALIGCAVIFDVITLAESKDPLYKLLGAIFLLGAASLVVSLLTGNKQAAEE